MKLSVLISAALVVTAAFAATTATTSIAAVHWNYAGKELASGINESVTTKIKSSRVFLKVPALKLELEGTEVKSTAGYIEGTKTDGAKSIIFTGFIVKGASGVCEVKSLGQPTGTVATKEVKTFLHEVSASEIDDVFTPTGKKATGEEFFTLEIAGANCALSQTMKVTGSFVSATETPNTGATSQALNFPTPALKITEGSETFGVLLLGTHEAVLSFESIETVVAEFGAYA